VRKDLAETLLAGIMGWSDATKAAERARLESFASYKYDEYQQFAPGRRFIESLALWLKQFDAGDERRDAYHFVRNRLVFLSASEINHLVELTFPIAIRPHLIGDAAAELGIRSDLVKAITTTSHYRARLRRTLVLGMSDGAHTDWFRRANPLEMSNEQVFHAYDVSEAKGEDLTAHLRKDLTEILGRDPTDAETRFQYVVLLDDFSASGTSALRKDSRGGWTGKIAKVVELLEQDVGLGATVAAKGVRVMVILYVAADQAIAHIEEGLSKLSFSKGTLHFDVIHRLGPSTPLDASRDKAIIGLAQQDRYFDDTVDDEHAAVAGTSKRLGYANCRLPVVLSHNTPNNSIFLLWAEDVQSVRGLFPRVDRHRKRH
jgi:hypothetical protein